MSNTTKYYVDESGVYLGGFVGAEPPEGSVEVSGPPEHGLQTWNGSGWNAAPYVAPTLPKRDFMRLFTDNERNTITAAALQSVPLARWKEGLLLADDIRLDHPDLLAGMAYIVSQGYLTEARKDAILAGEATP